MDRNNNISSPDWINQKLTGHGKYTWADGSRYVGEWVNGEMHGFGKLEWKNGNIYIGSWKNDHRSGQGKYEWHDGSKSDGDIYEGGFQSSTLEDEFLNEKIQLW